MMLALEVFQMTRVVSGDSKMMEIAEMEMGMGMTASSCTILVLREPLAHLVQSYRLRIYNRPARQ